MGSRLWWITVGLVACGGTGAEPSRTADDQVAASPRAAAPVDDTPAPDLLALVPEGPANVVLAHFDRLRDAGLLDAAAGWLMAWDVPAGRPLSQLVNRVLVTPSLAAEDPALVILEHSPGRQESLRGSQSRSDWGATFEVGSQVVVSAQAPILEAARAISVAPSVQNEAAARLQALRAQHVGATLGVEIAAKGGTTKWPPGLAALRTAAAQELEVSLLLGRPCQLLVRAQYATAAEARRVEQALAREQPPSPITSERARTDATLQITLGGDGEALLTWLGASQ